jgi:hypothetical protein
MPPQSRLPAAAQYARASHQSTQTTGWFACVAAAGHAEEGVKSVFHAQNDGCPAVLGPVASHAAYAALVTSVASTQKVPTLTIVASGHDTVPLDEALLLDEEEVVLLVDDEEVVVLLVDEEEVVVLLLDEEEVLLDEEEVVVLLLDEELLDEVPPPPPPFSLRSPTS